MHGRRARRVRSLAGGALTVAFAVSLAASTSAAHASPVRPQSRSGVAPSAASQPALPIYRNTHYSFAERAADLVSRMTLAEKVQQLQTNNAPAIPRLGVQQYTYWSEGQHGLNRLGADTAEGGQGAVDDVHATSFPVNFASTMSWDPSLMYDETTAISDEARGYLDKSLFTTGQNNIGPNVSDYGDLTFWAPTVNMDRDPRWGRTDEAFGEDPYLVGQMAGAFVDGYQGETMTGQQMTPYLKVATTAKHYALNNVEDNRNSGSSDTTDANIRDYYTKQFQSLTENAHVSGVMTSYNAVNGTPSPADTYTVNELLQRTYGFNGYTTSDCGAVGDIYNNHQWTPPGWTSAWTNPVTGQQVSAPAGAQAYALRAGTDLNCTGSEPTLANIQAAISAGVLSEGVLDNALVHLFTIRMETGEFDPPSKVAYTKITKSVIQSPAHQALAEKVAADDLVLLKNDNVAGTSSPLLPADPSKLSNVVVVGNLANTVTLGGYSGQPSLQVNAVQGITAAVKAANQNATVTFDSCGTSTTTTSPASCSAATQAAIKAADLVIVFVGTDENVASEGNDRTSLEMPGNYNSLISQVNALGNPRTALVIQSDGPVDISSTQGDFPAIVFSGYNGESQGTALAQALFGQVNPSGHLDFTWFKDDSQLPDMQNYGLTPSQTGGLGRTYMYFTGTPTYPFGYGLSYTHFAYSDVSIAPKQVSADGTVHVNFNVTNTGTVPGATVAQLNVAPQFTVPGVELPKEQLEGFQRTAVLAPGHSQHVTLTVKAASLSQWDEQPLKQAVYDGAYQFRVGPDSATVAGSGTVAIHGAITPHVQDVTVQPDQVVFKPGDTLDLTGKNPWIAPDTNSSLEQPHASADNIVEAVNNDQSFADLSKAKVSYTSSNPSVATASDAGVVTMRAPGVATIDVTVNGVTGSAPIEVQVPFTLQAPNFLKSGSTFSATTAFTNTGTQVVRGLQMSLDAPSGWTATAASPASFSSVGPGQQVTTSWNVTIPGTASPGNQTELDATAAFTGAAGPYTEDAVSQATVTSGATPEQATPVITQMTPAAGSLQVLLDNPSTTPTTVTAVNWTLGSQSGTQALSSTTIAPQSSATVSVNVGSPSFGTSYPFTVTSVVSGGQSSAPLSGHVSFLPVAQKTLGSSWSLSDVQDGPSVDLGNWGAVGSPQAPAGLSGKVWLDWDSSNLYVTAEVTDDNFSEPATGANIWQGDSLQVAATSGVPGSSATVSTASTNAHYEYGAALTPQGAQAYRWTAPAGVATGPVTDGAVQVTRDDATNTTVYELALPWSDLTSAVQPGAGEVFSISALLNDTDNGVREGFLQWGGGIGPDKNVAEFNMAQLMP
jgi:beta-glucosidase-like glycosyl hydrolase